MSKNSDIQVVLKLIHSSIRRMEMEALDPLTEYEDGKTDGKLEALDRVKSLIKSLIED